MAKANYAGKVSTNLAKKEKLQQTYPINSVWHSRKNKKEIKIVGYWGDRCIIADDNNIYNTDYDILPC